MAIGKARLDFRRPENREFWLAAYRYVGTLGQRGTWRTAFEWAKLILSLDPEQDPYNIRLIIDQLAIRSAQYDTLVELAETPTDVLDWGQKMPNVQISLAMAYYKLKKLEQAQKTLRDIISLHPWVLANLYQELSIETIPNSVWARQPRTNREKLSTLSYGLRAKDIWNTPEAVSFLQSVVEAAKRDEPPIPATDPEEMELSMADCRHILLSETPTLMALLPRDIFNHRSSASDPVPPSDEIRSYNLNTSETISNDPEQDLQAEHLEAGNTESWFSSVLQRLGLVPNPVTNENDPAVNQQIAAAPETPETDINGIAQRSDSVNELDDFFRSERRISAQEQTPQEASTELQIHQHQNLPSESPQLNAPLQPSVEDDPDDEQPHLPASNTSHEQQPLLSPSTTYNDEANQRWLAGRGMLRLKDFISQHGPDENKWRDDLEIDITPATEYAHRITLLESRASREFILKYALQQGAGTQASELVRRLLE